MTTRPTEDSVPREPRLDAAWRAASNEEPPPALDAAILAAARREVGAKPQSLSAQAATQARRRWWPLAAAATVAVIAIGVVQRAGHDELVAPPGGSVIVTDIPAPSAKSAAESPQSVKEPTPDARADVVPSGGGAPAGGARVAAVPAPPTTRNADPASRADAPRRAAPNTSSLLEKKSEPAPRDSAALPEPFPAASPKPDATTARDATTPASSAGEIAAAASAPQVSPPSAPVAQPSVERGSAQRQEAAASFADSARAPAQSALRSSPVAKTATAGAAQEARIKDRAPLPIPDWIALIRRLRDEGKTADAARELAAFRSAHTDHERLLPPDLRDWRPAEK
jgi:hypothetical protein